MRSNLLITALFVMAFTALVSGYTIEGDTVIYENQYGKITQTPHTITDLSESVVINATSNFSIQQNLNFALGFDTSGITPVKAFKWTDNATHEVKEWCSVSHSRSCDTNNFSYTTDPKYAWCYYDNSSIKWNQSFVNGWVANKTIEWFDWEYACTDTQYYDDWTALNNFEVLHYNDKKWFVISANFQPQETKSLKVDFEVKPKQTGKYDLFIKRSSDTWTEAFANGHYVLLDPWYSVSWGYRKPLNVTESYGLERYQEPLTINVTGLTLETANCRQELRVTAIYNVETSIPFSVINNTGQTAGIGDAWCVVQFLLNMTNSTNATYTAKNETNYYIYYNNSVAPNVTVQRLYGWNVDFEGMPTPEEDAWLNTSMVAVTNYTYNSSGNALWNFNDTGATGIASFYKLKSSSVFGWTYETRLQFDSDNGTHISTGFGFTRNAGTTAMIRVNASYVGVGDLNTDIAYNYKTYAGTTNFHTYRLTFNDTSNAYILYIDDALFLTGSNATAVTAQDRVWMGENQYTGTYRLNATVDYAYASNASIYPPLTSVLGSEENVTAEADYTSVYAYDEVTLVPLNFTALFYNSTAQVNFTGVFSVDVYSEDLPSGAVTLDVSSLGYYPRTYYLTINATTSVNLTAFLLNATNPNAIIVRFHVRTSFTSPILNATVTVQKNINSSIQTIGQKSTDFNGDTLFYLILNDPYFVLVSAEGYSPFFNQLTPTQNDYDIILYPTSNASIDAFPVNIVDDVYWFLKPFYNVINKETANITFFVNATNNDLTYFWLNVTNSTDGVLYFSNITNSSSGGLIYYNLNWTVLNNDTNVTALFGFSHSPDVSGRTHFFKGWFDEFTKTLEKVRDDFADSGLSKYGMALVFLIIALFIGAWVARINLMGSLIIISIILGFGAFTGAFDIPLTLGVTQVAGVSVEYISGFVAISFVFVTVLALLYLRERI